MVVKTEKEKEQMQQAVEGWKQHRTAKTGDGNKTRENKSQCLGTPKAFMYFWVL